MKKLLLSLLCMTMLAQPLFAAGAPEADGAEGTGGGSVSELERQVSEQLLREEIIRFLRQVSTEVELVHTYVKTIKYTKKKTIWSSAFSQLAETLAWSANKKILISYETKTRVINGNLTTLTFENNPKNKTITVFKNQYDVEKAKTNAAILLRQLLAHELATILEFESEDQYAVSAQLVSHLGIELTEEILKRYGLEDLSEDQWSKFFRFADLVKERNPRTDYEYLSLQREVFSSEEISRYNNVAATMNRWLGNGGYSSNNYRHAKFVNILPALNGKLNPWEMDPEHETYVADMKNLAYFIYYAKIFGWWPNQIVVR